MIITKTTYQKSKQHKEKQKYLYSFYNVKFMHIKYTKIKMVAIGLIMLWGLNTIKKYYLNVHTVEVGWPVKEGSIYTIISTFM